MSETKARYPQPREGITGTERTDDDLLSLDDKAVPRRLLMLGTASALYAAVLVGNPAPVVAKMHDRMRKPQPGDLVMEVGVQFRKSDPDSQIKGFGILIDHRKEWMSTDEEWAAEVANEPGIDPVRDRFADDAWYVQYGPHVEDVCRWTNCDFLAIPTDRSWGVPATPSDPGSRG